MSSGGKEKAWTFVDNIDEDEIMPALSNEPIQPTNGANLQKRHIDFKMSSSGASTDEFEVVPHKDVVSSNEFEVIPQQKIRSLDEKELELYENYFPYGNSQSTDSDSDIEVIPQKSEQHLYSQILQKNILNVPSPIHSVKSWDAEIDGENIDDGSHIDSDGSEVEVVSRIAAEDGDSLEIIFSNDNYFNHDVSSDEVYGFDMLYKENERGEHDVFDQDDLGIEELFENESEKEQEYNIKVLFEGYEDEERDFTFLFGNDRQENKDQLISMKTSTLVLVFCFCVAAGVLVGSGCASLFVINGEAKIISTPPAEKSDTNLPPEIFHFLSSKFNKLNITNIWSSSTTKKSVKDLLTSYHNLEHEHRVLKTSLDDLKERYHLQKQMTLFWKKKVKKNVVNIEQPKTTIYDGLMDVSDHHDEIDVIIQDIVNFSYPPAAAGKKTVNSSVIADLKLQLEREKENVKYWREKYTSSKLVNIRRCAKIGKSMPNSSFSFSACLTMLTKVLPDFNITSNLPSFAKPVERMADHVHNAWSKLKNRWRTESTRSGDQTTLKNVDRFRKIFKIGNVVNSIRSFQSANDVDNQKKYCPDEAFKAFQNRWKNVKNHEYPKPESRKLKRGDHCLKCFTIKQEGSKTIHKCGDETYEENTEEGFPIEYSPFPCIVGDGVIVEQINGKVRTIAKVNMPEEFQSQEEVNRKETKKQEITMEDGDSEIWYKKRLSELNFKFDSYKWQTNGKIRKVMSEVEDKLSTFKEEGKKSERNGIGEKGKESGKIKSEKLTKYREIIKELQQKIKLDKKKFEDWKFQEKLSMKYRLEDLKRKMKNQKKEYRKKVYKAKQFLKSQLKKAYVKVTSSKENLKTANKRVIQKLAYYKTKYQIVTEELMDYKLKYSVLKHMYQTVKTAIEAKPNDEETDIINNEESEKSTQRWRISMKFQAEQDKVKTDEDSDEEDFGANNNPHATIFDLAHFYSPEKYYSSSSTLKPSAPNPPKCVSAPQQHFPPSRPTTWNMIPSYLLSTQKPLKPVPPKRVNAPSSQSPPQPPAVWHNPFDSMDISKTPPKPTLPRSIFFPENDNVHHKGTESEAFLHPIRPSPPQRTQVIKQLNNTSVKDGKEDEKAVPYSWYLWMKHRDTYNQYEEDQRMNWYLSRIESRAPHYNEYDELKSMDWYNNRMKSRESYRKRNVFHK